MIRVRRVILCRGGAGPAHGACDDAADVVLLAGDFEADGGAGLMKNISIVGRASTFFVAVFGLFGVGGLAIGVMLVAGAGKVAAALHGTTATRIGVTGVVVIAVSLAIGGWTWRQLTAVCGFEIADDGTWTLITRRGKRTGVRPGRVSLELRGFNVWLFWSALPRRINVCSGAVVLDDRRYRLAQVAPTAYDRVLAALGVSAKAPRNTSERYDVLRAA